MGQSQSSGIKQNITSVSELYNIAMRAYEEANVESLGVKAAKKKLL